MKKRNLFIATLLVVAATTVAVVSCKKENQDTLLNNSAQPVRAFTPPQVDDMNAYLKDFKQRMLTATRGDGETLGLEEAAWHLSSVANYDFCNANVEFTDIRFDTLYSNVMVNGGFVLLSDLATAYERISVDIDKFYQMLSLDEKHFRFINASISENGEVVVSVTTTYKTSSRYLNDTCWYLSDVYEAMWYEDSLFNLYPTYPSNTLGCSELERVLNLTESHSLNAYGRVYYTPTSERTFYYRDEIDPFGSPNYLNSRLYATNEHLVCDIKPIMIYLFDSYAGLGYSNCPAGQCIARWMVENVIEQPFVGERFWKRHYRLIVRYAQKHELLPGTGVINY